jgi:hypothetical protein
VPRTSRIVKRDLRMTIRLHQPASIVGVAWSALAAGVTPEALAQSTPAAASTSVECADPNDAECPARKKAEQERRSTARPEDSAEGLAGSGVAIVPCVGDATGGVCGSTSIPPPVRRGPLNVRRLDISAGIDHALSPQWVAGALIGVGRGRLHRVQMEIEKKDTTIRTRSATLAATLTWFPAADIAIDGSLTYQRMSFDFERVDTASGQSRAFFGNNNGHSWGLSLNASTAWRGDGFAVIPQVGLDYASSQVDVLYASIADPPPGSIENFRVSEQRAKTLAALVGAQVQWPRSVDFGVAVPYLRSAWRQRLWHSSSPVTVTAPGPRPVEVDLKSQTSRQAATVAAGLLMQLSGGVSLFGDLGYTRGRGDVRETRLSVGFKLER